MSAIETDGLTKQFGSLTAVDDLDLTIERGEVFGFLGPNGAGKSTTINMLLDLTRPTSGAAWVLDRNCQAESEAIRERIGVLPEGFDLYGRLTGRQHLEFAIRAKDVDDDTDRLREVIGLDGDAIDRTVGGYSKGMRQRLALGMALAGDPEVLILDEPSTGLDPTGIEEVQSIIKTEAERGTAVLFSSHILGEVEAVCDRVGILNEGHLVAEGSIDSLRADLAGDTTMTLAVDGVSPDVVAEIEAVDGVHEVSVTDGHLVVGCSEPRAKARVIAVIEAKGTPILDVRIQDRSLTDIFTELTSTDGGTTDA